MFDFISFHWIMLVISSGITIVKYISDGAYVCQQPWAMSIAPSMINGHQVFIVVLPWVLLL